MSTTSRAPGGTTKRRLAPSARGLAGSQVSSNHPRPNANLTGWVLLPLRAFLGITFIYAGLNKLANRDFFTASAPGSIQEQLHAAATNSPIQGIVGFASHHAVLVGLAIALGELAVGAGALLGLWTRIAAVGGILLSLGFLLAVSWHTHPYFLGPDIFSLFAWTPLAVAGAGGVWSLDDHLRHRTREEMRLAPAGPVVVDFATVRRLCGYYDKGRCNARERAFCEPTPCPVLAAKPRLEPGLAAELDRRAFLQKAGVAVPLGLGLLTLGGVTAAIGRLVPSSSSSTATARLGGSSRPSGSPSGGESAAGQQPSNSSSSSSTSTRPEPTTAARPSGTAIGDASQVPVGGAARFTDPATGEPAYVIRPSSSSFRAFSAICTHQGCPVQYQGNDFVCPCHGAMFSTKDGGVLRGPARRPLSSISVAEGPDGKLYVDG